MIAFLCSDLGSGYRIMQADMPAARIEKSTMRVFFNPASKIPSGVIVAQDDKLRSYELSGYVMLTEDIDPRLMECARIMTRKPFYWHIRDPENA